MTTARWPHAVVREIVDRCEAHPDRESCGFVVRRSDALQVIEMSNVAARAREGYEMDAAELLRLHRDLAASGGAIVAVWHSHLDGTASPSARDRADAVAGGVEQLPGAEYVVVALRGRRAVSARAHRLVAGRFVETADLLRG